MKECINKTVPFIESGFIFKILYLILGLLSFNNLFSGSLFLTISSVLLTLVGGVYLVIRIFHFNKYRKTKGLVFLILFVASFAVSSLLNAKYGLTENIKGGIWMVFQFFLLYAYDERMSKDEAKREFKIFSHVFLIYSFLMALVGIVLLFLNFQYYKIVNGKTIIIGFLWNRLWGLYSDPNYGAIFGVVSIVLCIYFLLSAKKKWQKCLYILTIISQVAYIAFSDSRTALVAFMLTSGILVFLFAIRWKKLQCRNKLLSGFLAVILAAFGCVLPFFITQVTANAGSHVLQAIHQSISLNPSGDEAPEEDPELNIGRQDEDMNNDISNRRFAIWKSAMEVTSTKPIFGVSFRNIVPYARENLPNTYIVNNDHTSFASMHNVFVDTTVSQGIIGLALWVAFVVVIFVNVLTRLFKKKDKNYYELVLLLCAVLPIAISAMFYSEILYINTGGAVFFWCVLGYFMHGLTRKDDGNKEVGILTFHNARNYGACLQTLALQTKLEEMGHSAEIVDYQPAAIEDDFGIIIKNHFREACKSPISLIKFVVSTLLHLPWRTVKENKFIAFRQNYYHLSEATYSDNQQLSMAVSQNKMSYPFYFFGSDQIWNPAITRGVDPAFYGAFASNESVKASYAASTGTAVPSEEVQSEIKNQLKNLNAISVRESDSKKWLSALTDKEIHTVIDPTLLLTAETWDSYCKKIHIKKPYIFVYVLEINESLISTVTALSKEKNLPVVFFDLKNRYGCKAYSKYTADPLEFISYLKHAEYVVTNSFHGTVFSIVFKKKFICVPNQKNPTRMVELLKNLGLENRLYQLNDHAVDIDEDIDFASVHQKLDVLRVQSQNYLEEVFSL